MVSDRKQMLFQLLDSLKNGIKKFEFVDKWPTDTNLGAKIEQLNINEFIFRQLFLIQRVVALLNITNISYNKREVPAYGPLFGRDISSPERKHIDIIDLLLACLDTFKPALNQIFLRPFINAHQLMQIEKYAIREQ